MTIRSKNIYFLNNILNKILYSFRLDLSQDADHEVMNESDKLLRLPNLIKLTIVNALESNINLKLFMPAVAPKQLREFWFGSDHEKPALNVEYYSEAL